jgi:hypothetical protein
MEGIPDIQRTLSNGSHRIVQSDAPLRLSYFPGWLEPDDVVEGYFGPRPLSEAEKWLLSPSSRTIEREFHQEIDALKEWLKRTQPSPANTPEDRIMRQAEVNAAALSLWDRYAVPIRTKEGLVHRIWTFRDPSAPPRIEAMPLDDFLVAVCRHTARREIDLRALSKKLDQWRQVAGLLCVLLIAMLAILLNVK